MGPSTKGWFAVLVPKTAPTASLSVLLDSNIVPAIYLLAGEGIGPDMSAGIHV